MNRPSTDVTRHEQVSESRFAEQLELFVVTLRELDQRIDPGAVPARNDAWHAQVRSAFDASQVACRQFEQVCRDRDQLADVQQRFRKRTAPWFSRSWIADRARSKPSGFPGDYEMLIKLYEQRTPATGLGGYLDLCISELPLARAVRGRLRSAQAFLMSELSARRGDVRILDVASGPCWEYRSWPPRAVNEAVEIVAMDSDPAALEYVQRQVADAAPRPFTLTPVRYNALRTRNAVNTTRQFGRFDILYSVGLCDYLSDEHLVPMLSAWRETLNDGGALYVAFKDTLRYDKTPYQWHLDWFFFQRTVDDVLALYQTAGFDTDSIATARDETGVTVSFLYRRDAARTLRQDPPASPAARSRRQSGVRPRKSSGS